ncbi:MAG: nucleotidyl transferase AbiEii/AbiGii toxin family protein [Anaerosomatales bacterium]|nr:nucleotidyl transferase AbiEii/AbiGii toxin family protein [Anaerosomatales bacterium]
MSEPVRQPLHEGLRMSVRSLLDGREFETFPVDVGIGDPVTAAPEPLRVTRLLEFAGVEPTLVPCYPLVQHVAEKLHAYSRPHGARENSRVKDYVDLVCLAERYAFEAEALDQAIQAAFNARATHPLPPGLADPPASWTPEYRRMAKEVDADAGELAVASPLLRAFFEPMMNGSATGVWDPGRAEWC